VSFPRKERIGNGNGGSRRARWTPNHLRQFFPTLTRVTERLKKRWTAAADGGEAVDVPTGSDALHGRCHTNLAFGYDMNTLRTRAT